MSGTEPATVLVVDDERDVADAYAAQLSDEFIVSTAYSGKEALEKVDASVDVVLLDRRMPGISGDEVLEKIRQRELNCRVAMVTAVDPDFDIIDMPFDDYIIKPVSRDDLLETINQLLTTAEYESTLRRYYALTAKHATLLANKPESELAQSEEFQTLESEMHDLRSELDETLLSFDDSDFEAAFRDLSTGSE
ncbi:response regulator transcription factor [Halovenus marina]|uniref:response regulator transcription factor n=1 Tax=Halovenus marina TaxID=3396621 RepID=UPI003F54EB59